MNCLPSLLWVRPISAIWRLYLVMGREAISYWEIVGIIIERGNIRRRDSGWALASSDQLVGAAICSGLTRIGVTLFPECSQAEMLSLGGSRGWQSSDVCHVLDDGPSGGPAGPSVGGERCHAVGSVTWSRRRCTTRVMPSPAPPSAMPPRAPSATEVVSSPWFDAVPAGDDWSAYPG